MTATTTQAPFTLYRERDDYGRTCYANYAIRGIVVVIPRRTQGVLGYQAFVNLRNPEDAPGTIHQFKTTAAAKEFLLANGKVTTR